MKRLGFLVLPLLLVLLAGCQGGETVVYENGPFRLTENKADVPPYLLEIVVPKISQDGFGEALWDGLWDEWESYARMDEMSRMASSHLFGLCSAQLQAWDDVTEFIGFPVDNPLEGQDWLTDADVAGVPLDAEQLQGLGHHVDIDYYGSDVKTLEYVHLYTAYLTGDCRVFLNAAIHTTAYVHPWQSVWDETPPLPVREEYDAMVLGPVQGEGYTCADAYLIRGDVLYHLYVTQDQDGKDDTAEVLERCLALF